MSNPADKKGENTMSYFTRGVVGTALLGAVSGIGAKKMVKISLQGGVATAAGYSASQCLKNKDYLNAGLSITAGLAGVKILESILNKGKTKG